MEIALILLTSLTLALVGLLLWKLRGGPGERDRQEAAAQTEAALSALRQELSILLSQNASTLSGLVTKTGADMRQEVSDRLTKGLVDVQEKVELKLSQGREESARSMKETTEAVIRRLGESGEKTETRIAALEKKTSESLDSIREKVNERLMEIGRQVQAKLDENIKEGFAHFEKVQEHLKNAEKQLIGVAAVGNSINELSSLLKLPHLRGGFGEATLERILADVLPASLYEMQAQVTPNSTERVDVLIKLPGANLPIDSKFPREQVLPLFETCDTAGLAEARKALARAVKEQAKDIAAKYIRPEHGTTEMALMFLPSETLYFEVVRNAELWSAMQGMKVYPVSPNTLAVTLMGVSLSRKYYDMAKGVEKTIEDIRKATRHFGHFRGQFDGVGKELDRAREAWGKANTHLNNYSNSVTRLTGESAIEASEAEPSLPENKGTPDLLEQ